MLGILPTTRLERILFDQDRTSWDRLIWKIILIFIFIFEYHETNRMVQNIDDAFSFEIEIVSL